MEELQQLLKQQVTYLTSLTQAMAEEQRILCEGFIEARDLHQITERKIFLLSALSHSEQQRLNLSKALNIIAPYDKQPLLATLWQQIGKAVIRVRDLNTHNGSLLTQHLDLNSKAIAFLKSHHSPSLYGSDGQAARYSMLSGHKVQV
ncbi:MULTISPECIES: flagella synthesis protein FlgN [Photorhabdus]|uniref:Flagellar biosynthesis protein FlgN n=1 Tax=Photorhabdus bodei TaxID=2029681 RepID=A0A329XCX1_9GAMM|nr:MULTISPECIES: flagellar export chaperone FlgN [Photorhabdus]MCT8345359.1 flagellar export chaperone FlgN [Photorhabdus kleinii]NDK98300.1 flagellar biosynthesis protein FlgN [Photorhabdus bodei]NDL02551.1 flagellar biosynthesis protein FlgN [Photorhabdus bodei]NDL06625.1 flagellar biosynthesis protein FlgN [Photorhabdus bodei]RAW94667.1 flagellar biosynthesis protein FlgN [Photorhabdus sp. S9-53]